MTRFWTSFAIMNTVVAAIVCVVAGLLWLSVDAGGWWYVASAILALVLVSYLVGCIIILFILNFFFKILFKIRL